jgi:hypothetical protein
MTTAINIISTTIIIITIIIIFFFTSIISNSKKALITSASSPSPGLKVVPLLQAHDVYRTWLAMPRLLQR